MKKCTAVLAGLIAMGVLSGFGWSSAKISEIKTCKQVEPKEKTPVDITDTFAADTPVVYCTAKLANAPEGTSVKAEYYYLEGGEQKIAETNMPDLSGTRYISFKLNPPPSGWPLGKYKVVIQLDGKPKGEALFTVVAAGEIPAARTAAPEAPDYRTFSSDEYGFTMKYPSNWVEGERPSPAIAFLYLANSKNEPVSNINVQVIPVTLKDASQTKEAVNLIAQQLIDQISKTQGSAIKNDEWIDVGKNSGRELVFEYPYQKKALKQRQFVTFYNNNVYAVIYTAEAKVYENFLGSYEKAIESLTFSEK